MSLIRRIQQAMSPPRLALLISYWLMYIAIAQPTSRPQHLRPQNQIANGCFKISGQEYESPSTRVAENNLLPWVSFYHTLFEISRQNDFQGIISKKKFEPSDINMCVFRSTQRSKAQQNFGFLQGWYFFKMTVLAGGSTKSGFFNVDFQGSQLQSNKLLFAADGTKVVLSFYIEFKPRSYHIFIYLGIQNPDDMVAGITQVGLFSCAKTPESWLPFGRTPQEKEPDNLLGNGQFSFPEVPWGKNSIKIYTNGAKPWFTVGKGRIVKCAKFNPSIKCKQAYLLTMYTEPVTVFQIINIQTRGDYQFSFKYAETSVSSRKGEVIVRVNGKQVCKLEVDPNVRPQRLNPKTFTKVIQLNQGQNRLSFHGSGFRLDKAGIMFTNVIIKSTPESSKPPKQPTKQPQKQPTKQPTKQVTQQPQDKTLSQFSQSPKQVTEKPSTQIPQAQHHSSLNLILNGKFVFQDQPYKSPSTTVLERNVQPWKEQYFQSLEISTQTDIQQIIEKKILEPRGINMCVFRSLRSIKVKQQFYLQTSGWYIFTMKVVAGSHEQSRGSLIVTIQGKESLKARQKLIFPTNGEETRLFFYSKLYGGEQLQLSICTDKSNKGTFIVGLSQVALSQCTKSEVTAAKQIASLLETNLVLKNKFSFPELPSGVESVNIYEDGAYPWVTLEILRNYSKLYNKCFSLPFFLPARLLFPVKVDFFRKRCQPIK